MKIIINDSEYVIKDDIWEKHILMHPIRSKEALISNIKIVFDNRKFSSKDIENLIMNEYSLQMNMADIITNAREIYDDKA